MKPESELEEIIQNIRTILTTPKGTVPLMRDFGVNWRIVDTLTPKAEMEIKEEIYWQIRTWEKRADVKKITIGADSDGRLKATVTIETDYGVVNVSSG